MKKIQTETQAAGAAPASSLKKVKHEKLQEFAKVAVNFGSALTGTERSGRRCADGPRPCRKIPEPHSMKLVGALLAGIGNVGIPVKNSEAELNVTDLPEVCEELPEELNGVLDLISYTKPDRWL